MTDTTVEIDGRQLKLSNLEKVLYPATGFTKGEVIDYYARIAPTMLTHIGDRGITMRRFPNGVDGKSFFEKRCPKHRPDWLGVCPGPGDHGGAIDYCCLGSVPAIVWSANLAALEIHAPMARCGDIETPCMVVFDLDPGEPAAMRECAEVGLWLHDVFDHMKLEAFAKTSGSKGLQVYLPVNGQPLTHEQAGAFALQVAQAMEKHHGDKVLSNMRKELRKSKVFIDWSQNSRHKTTIGAYSLRARPHPTVSTPVTWDEVAAAADGEPLSFEAPDVLERVERLGDLWEPTATLQQEIPLP
ncbi:MAG TPA: non-homologous end-joining DNA ligase [Acidimicrobiales bacterium]|nr:non-homologous end-joining DNA ligase [Acidimicrobiales bacterium]